MKNIKINEYGYVESYYTLDASIDIEIDEETYLKISSYPENHNWRYLEGQFILECLDINKDLRSKRQYECFDILDNRSTLWYELLTYEQKEELKKWYNDWLNVTITHVIPEKPSWIK